MSEDCGTEMPEDNCPGQVPEEWSRDEKARSGKTLTQTEAEQKRQCVGGRDSTSWVGIGGGLKRGGKVGNVCGAVTSFP